MSRSDQAPEHHAGEPVPVPHIGTDGRGVLRSPAPPGNTGTTERFKLFLEYLRWTQSDWRRTCLLIAMVVAVALSLAGVLFVLLHRTELLAGAIVIAALIIGITVWRRSRPSRA